MKSLRLLQPIIKVLNQPIKKIIARHRLGEQVLVRKAGEKGWNM